MKLLVSKQRFRKESPTAFATGWVIPLFECQMIVNRRSSKKVIVNGAFVRKKLVVSQN
jgi:hypothetical protein